MSSTPAASVTAPNPIQQGLALYDKRILPAKLDNSTRHNGLFFGRYIHAKGLDANTLSPKQISDLLYEATVKDCEQEKPEIKWLTPPKTLTKRTSVSKPVKVADPREASTFEERVRSSEKVDAAQREQDAARKRVEALVERFAPVLRGVMKYGLREKMQGEWNEKLKTCKDYVRAEKEIRQEQADIYAKLERQGERL